MSSFPSEVIGTDKSESTSGQVRMGRSKTEKLIPHILAEDAARIFDDNVPVQQKVYYEMLLGHAYSESVKSLALRSFG